MALFLSCEEKKVKDEIEKAIQQEKPKGNIQLTKIKTKQKLKTAFNQNTSGWVRKRGSNIANMFTGATAMQESHKLSWAR